MIFNVFRQSVRAQQKRIPIHQNARTFIRHRHIMHANRTGDHIAARPCCGLILGYGTGAQQLVHFCMINGHLGEMFAAQQIDPAVARPDTGKVPIKRQQPNKRCAHRCAVQSL